MPSTCILGLGNVLMGDDGFGPAVVHAFEREYETAGDAEIVDLGTPGLDLTPWLADADRIILIDTVNADLPPGSRRSYDKADIVRHAPTVRVSPHDPGVKETLLTLEFAGRAPREVLLLGVVPQTTALGVTLSDPVRAAIPATIETIVDALTSAGIVVRRRPQPLASATWAAIAG